MNIARFVTALLFKNMQVQLKITATDAAGPRGWGSPAGPGGWPWPAAGASDRTAARQRRPGASSTYTGLAAHSSSLCPLWASTAFKLAGPAALAHPPGQEHHYRARSRSAAAAWPGPALSTSTVPPSTSLTRSRTRTNLSL